MKIFTAICTESKAILSKQFVETDQATLSKTLTVMTSLTLVPRHMP